MKKATDSAKSRRYFQVVLAFWKAFSAWFSSQKGKKNWLDRAAIFL